MQTEEGLSKVVAGLMADRTFKEGGDILQKLCLLFYLLFL